MIVVCGQPRSGTSMVMRMLEMGGIILNYSQLRNQSDLMQQFRNPYGFFEMIPPRVEGNFKCIWPKMITEIPLNAKLIRITRQQNEMIASWNAVRGQPISDERINQIANMKKKWNNALAFRSYLALDYDTIIANPIITAQNIADFIREPFDVQAAAKAVDTTLYVDRKL
jgi:hypothetical protein